VNFLTNGDFVLPFSPHLYLLKYLFTWSHQSGGANLDGITRMPSRIIYMLVFIVSNNIVLSYFFLFSTLVIAFISFWVFAKVVLGLRPIAITVLGSLVFALNPVFLGNLAKTGLVFSAGLLPLMLALVNKLVTTRRFAYSVPLLLALILSLVHPFTFVVNCVAVAAYWVFLARRLKRPFILQMAGALALCVALCAYFLLPVAAVGSIDKSALSQDAVEQAIDYTSLVGIANTGDVFTAFTLSKNVFKDFDFYDSHYQAVFVASSYLLIILLVGLFAYRFKKLSRSVQEPVIILMCAFLALLLLSTGTFLHINNLINYLIGLPGGWIFRAPLKWQLYLPVVVAAMATLLVANTRHGYLRMAAIAGLALYLLASNGFIVTSIYSKLLKPKHFASFSSFINYPLDDKTLLFVSSEDCADYSRRAPDAFAELNQVLASRNIEVKRASENELDALKADDYDYVIACKSAKDLAPSLAAHFKEIESTPGQGLVVYQNLMGLRKYSPFLSLYAISQSQSIQQKNDAVSSPGKPFYFSTHQGPTPSLQMLDLLENITPASLSGQAVSVSSKVDTGILPELFIEDKQPVYYSIGRDSINLSRQPGAGLKAAPANGVIDARTLGVSKKITATFTDSSFVYRNLIPDPSFEQGLWQKQVTDCYAYDSNPQIGMQLSHTQKSQGAASLQIQASQHIACTGPDEVPVQPRALYMLSFDYQSSNAKEAGFSLQFNDQDITTTALKLPIKDTAWHTYSVFVEAPATATSAKLDVYSYPSKQNDPKVNYYDNFILAEVPNVLGKYFLVSGVQPQLVSPEVTYDPNSPTSARISIKNAQTAFYLSSNEAYDQKWQLEMNNKKIHGLGSWLPVTRPDAIAADYHFKLDNFENGWYVDPAALCKGEQQACKKNADGSYDIELVAEFTPQRWFYLGGIISTATLAACLGYLVYDWRRIRGLRVKKSEPPREEPAAPQPPEPPEPPAPPEPPRAEKPSAPRTRPKRRLVRL
jgi:hypothetical protein